MFYVGRQFSSYQVWQDIFEDYKKKNKLVFTIADCHRLKACSDIDQSIVDTFKYSYVKLSCKFGPSRGSQATKRQTR